MKSNIETYLRLKPLLEDNDNNNDSKKVKSKMINYEIENNQKNLMNLNLMEYLNKIHYKKKYLKK